MKNNELYKHCSITAKRNNMTFRKSLKHHSKYVFRDKTTREVLLVADTLYCAYCHCLLGYLDSYNRSTKTFEWLV